jgi:hypothetical protein
VNETSKTLFADSSGVEVVPAFARHETFHPRYGWLRKGFVAAQEDPAVFLSDDATTTLGVGKNMVRAIRYWCQAFKVLEEHPHPSNPRLRVAYPTSFGQRLLGDDGWDPFLESETSLWLLHAKLLEPQCLAPSWFALFNLFAGRTLTLESLVRHLEMFRDRQAEWPTVARGSLEKDARCILRMYAGENSGRDLQEDTVDSPFGYLGLVNRVAGDQGTYSINRARKDALPDLVVTYSCIEYLRNHAGGARLMTLSRLTNEPSSPGRVFLLSEAELSGAIARCQEGEPEVGVVQAAGIEQLVVGSQLAEDPSQLVDRLYEQQSHAVGVL